MRNVLSLACLMVFLAVATPAQAQHRADIPKGHASVRLFEHPGASQMLNKLFSPEHFRMGHSYEMSFGSFGGGSSMGMYTNTMAWQFNQKLAARVDISYAFSPFGGGNSFFGQEEQGGRLFLRNAEVAYRPSENVNPHFAIRQSPYGSYMGPYGYHGYMPGYYGYDTHREPLFWNDGRE